MAENVNVNVQQWRQARAILQRLRVKQRRKVCCALRTAFSTAFEHIALQRYAFQNNIYDANVTRTTNLSLRIDVILGIAGPAAGTSDILACTTEVNPVDFPVSFPSSREYDYIRWGGKS